MESGLRSYELHSGLSGLQDQSHQQGVDKITRSTSVEFVLYFLIASSELLKSFIFCCKENSL